MTRLSLLLNESDLLVMTQWKKHAGSFKDFWLNYSRTLCLVQSRGSRRTLRKEAKLETPPTTRRGQNAVNKAKVPNNFRPKQRCAN